MDIKITGLDSVLKRLDDLGKAASPQQNAHLWSSMRCPTHGKAPTNVRVVGDHVNAEFCCETFRQTALRATEAAIKRATR